MPFNEYSPDIILPTINPIGATIPTISATNPLSIFLFDAIFYSSLLPFCTSFKCRINVFPSL
nr:MAG TPA: hypothetical protein [Caudoviricetes sp.]